MRFLTFFLLTVVAYPAVARADSYGSEANPTGEPVGGGTGYSRILSPGDADVVVSTRTGLLDALGAATSGTTIYVADDAVIDLSGEMSIPIPGGVTLASGRGRNGSEGALLYTTSAQQGHLFVVQDPCVRITGIRIEGPYPGTERLDFRPNGIYSGRRFTEVDNCELFGWSSAAISYSTGATTGSYAHHNYIHHNQRDGLGYGVVLNAEHIFIIGNLFDFCRHAIAATGRPGSGYDARWNVHLEHTISHIFDMHGERDYDKYVIVGLWHLDEGSGVLTDDYSIYNGDHNGALVNMTDANWTTGKIDKGVWFDGVDDYIDLGNHVNLCPSPSMTLAAWVKAESVAGAHTVFGKGDSGETGAGYTLRIRDGQLEAVVYDATGARHAASGGSIVPDTWHYVVLTRDASTVRLYVDAVEAASFPCAGSTPSSYRLLLGRDAPTASGHFHGVVDEARLYSKVLESDAIARHTAGDADVAGAVIRVDHNTFRATNYEALTVRGRPTVGCWVYRNRLYAFESGRTFRQTNATGNWFVYDNLFRQGPAPPLYPGAGALGQWLFDEALGDTAHDTSGNGNNGTLADMSPVSSWTPGTSGTALVFSRSTGRVEVPLSATMGVVDNVAFSFMLRFDALDRYEEVFDNGFFRFYHRGEWAGDRLYFLARIQENDRSGESAWNYWSGVRTNTQLEAGRWYRIDALRSGDRMAIAVDGEIESDLDVFGDGYTPNPAFLTTGRLGEDFDGALDTFRMFRLEDAADSVCPASLDWTGEPHYETDGLDPEAGVSTATFRFRVRLTDSTGAEPAIGFPRLHILRDGEPYTNEAPVTMMAVDLTSMTMGRNYVYSMRLPRSTGYSYFFETETQDGLTTRTPLLAGPSVPSGGSAPLLSLASVSGYVIDGVEPDEGHVETVFDFRIKYTDLDDDPPGAGMPLLRLEEAGVPVAGSPFVMRAVDAADYFNGRTYSATMTLPASDTYRYRFETTDIEGMAARPTSYYAGPYVASGADVTAPNITAIEVADITQTTARIAWQTDEPASSAADYGATAAYGSRAQAAVLTTSHNLSLSGLAPGATVHFRLQSTDAAGNTATTGDYTFQTQARALPASAPAWRLYR